MHVQRPISEPLRKDLTWEQRWRGPDEGLIACWERGRSKANEDSELAEKAKQGHLVMLPWKGGIDRATKKSLKYGTLQYLAMWLGLRGEDLAVSLSEEYTQECTATGMCVTFTNDPAKYSES